MTDQLGRRVSPAMDDPALEYLPCALIRIDGLGARMREERERLGLLQRELADQLALARMTVYRYEAGEQLPALGALAQMQRLGANVHYVLSGEPGDTGAGGQFVLDTGGVGRRLRHERERVGFEQGALAEALGIQRATQSRYEQGYALPSLEYVERAHRLGIDGRYMLASQRSALLLGWSDTARLAGALERAYAMFAEGEAPSPLAVAGKVLQVLIPRVAHAPASR